MAETIAGLMSLSYTVMLVSLTRDATAALNLEWGISLRALRGVAVFTIGMVGVGLLTASLLVGIHPFGQLAILGPLMAAILAIAVRLGLFRSFIPVPGKAATENGSGLAEKRKQWGEM